MPHHPVASGVTQNPSPRAVRSYKDDAKRLTMDSEIAAPNPIRGGGYNTL